ncbi:MAG: glycosyltransferase family 4 protein [Chloroflexaceae bacterium]|nr:glycosyltransferase family 4 protein [Chloroflexaceae bacterium]
MLERLRPDLLHIQYQTGAYGMHPAVNLLPWRLRSRTGPACPHLAVTFHDLREPYLFPKAGPLRRWITHRLAADCDLVVATNPDDLAALHRSGIAACHIPISSNIAALPPPGYEREPWRSRLGVRPGDVLVAYFGLLSPNKGVDLLLDALSDLARKPDQEPDQSQSREYPAGPRFLLLLIGGDATSPRDRAYADQVFATIERLWWRERVIITGHVDAVTVSAHLLAADCVALPFRGGASFRSGSLLAALSHGTPVVTTVEPGGRRWGTEDANIRLVDGEHALLVAPDDRRSLSQALRRLAQDPALRKRLSAGALQVAAHFTWETITRQHEQAYYRLLNRISPQVTP